MLLKHVKSLSSLLILVVFSCKTDVNNQGVFIDKQHSPKQELTNDQQQIDTLLTDNHQQKTISMDTSAIERIMIAAGLVNIQIIDSSIHVDVRYATTNNFMGKVLYENYHKVYLQKVVAERLKKAQTYLKSIDSTYSLLVFDGARPRSVQQAMWDAMDSIPVRERIKFLSNPAHGSIHNYGCAVDLTILDLKTGELLDMGAGYDDIRKIAYPRYEAHYLEMGQLTPQQVTHRKLLRKVMRKGGFWVIQTEWWHFNAFSRKKAKELFQPIE